jgi:hypothetical protein
MLTSKSPRDVAMVALAAGKEAFSNYSHIYSPKKFTQPQLFACLVIKGSLPILTALRSSAIILLHGSATPANHP